MSTDRELLELAAKARGLPKADRISADGGHVFYEVGDRDCETWTTWNSLANDSDTMRLAMHLGIGVYETEKGVEARKGPDIVCEELGKTPAHYRRAITRVAAEIGRAMP